MWVAFLGFLVCMIALDLILLNRKKSEPVSVKQALCWTFFWVSLALVFNALLWWYVKSTQGEAIAYQKALEFFTGYLIEESLSVDNLFVFLMLFQQFAVPAAYQRRVLVYGILGAMVLRLIAILVGTVVISLFHWILYLFGLFLLFTGIK